MIYPAYTAQDIDSRLSIHINRISYSKRTSEWIATWFREFLLLTQQGEQQRYLKSLTIRIHSFVQLRRDLPRWIESMSNRFSEDERYANFLFRYNLAHL